MESVQLELYEARDTENAFALKLPGSDRWTARTGFGAELGKVWSVEIQSDEAVPDFKLIDWDSVLERVVEAYEMSDPIITRFRWPMSLEAPK
jgi:hypothetical protein